jgi:vacuolar-type H+-ATPase subunit H
MKISQSKVRVESNKAMPIMHHSVKGRAILKANVQKQAAARTAAAPKAPAPVKKTSMPAHPPARPAAEGFLSYNETAIALQRVLTSAREELGLIRRMKADAARYQQKTATKARSEAHQLVLNARLTTHREIEEIIRQASQEIQKMLADIRIVRITAQEELATQRRFTDAAKLNSISLSLKEAFQKATEPEKPEAVNS